MDEIADFSDDRNKAWCVHCGAVLAGTVISKDHVPTKTLLREPFPANLPIIPVCSACNQGFSASEQYLVAFLGCVLAGTTDPSRQVHPPAARILAYNSELRGRIERARVAFDTPLGERIEWRPEREPVEATLLKNARGHAMFEYGEPMLQQPDEIMAVPLVSLSAQERVEFEDASTDGWPEVGSRMMTRVMTGQDISGAGWVVVQDGVYRYAVMQRGLLIVRMVHFEYLAAEVSWD